MRNILLFAISALVMGLVLIAGEVNKMVNDQPDYQAYTRPRINMEEMK